MTEREFPRILGWPGYKVYRHEINEEKRTLRLWVRRKRGNKILVCGNCGGRAQRVDEVREREIRHLPCMKYQTWLVVEYESGIGDSLTRPICKLFILRDLFNHTAKP